MLPNYKSIVTMKTNNKIIFLTIISVIFIFFLFYSVRKNDSLLSSERSIVISDSTMLELEKYTIKKIKVGENIINNPISSQIVQIDEKDKYIMLDENKLYLFDLDSGELEDSVLLDKCGMLGIYSGFNYVDMDTIFVFNYKENLLFRIDNSGNVLSTWKVPQNDDTPEWVYSINALNASRIVYSNPFVSVSGGVLGVIHDSGFKKIPVSERLNTNNGEWMQNLSYPHKYVQKNFGAIYLNRIYTASDNENFLFYGFPIESEVYRYNSDFSAVDTLNLQSRYDSGRKECTKSQSELEENDRYEIQYYISQLSYSNIIFDNYRKLIIRAVNHPLNNWNYNQNFIQPRSFIFAKTDGTILSESRILKDYDKLDFGNMHICSDGLLIAEVNDNENEITFRCFKINMK